MKNYLKISQVCIV